MLHPVVGKMSNIELDKTAFYRRLKKLYSAWKEADTEDPLSKVDCIVTAVGVDEDTLYSKSTALQTWLFGYELTDTLALFCEDSVHFLASKKKIEFLKQVEGSGKEDGVPAIKLLVREKNDKDQANFGKLIEAIQASKSGKTIGQFAKVSFFSCFVPPY